MNSSDWVGRLQESSSSRTTFMPPQLWFYHQFSLFIITLSEPSRLPYTQVFTTRRFFYYNRHKKIPARGHPVLSLCAFPKKKLKSLRAIPKLVSVFGRLISTHHNSSFLPLLYSNNTFSGRHFQFTLAIPSRPTTRSPQLIIVCWQPLFTEPHHGVRATTSTRCKFKLIESLLLIENLFTVVIQ